MARVDTWGLLGVPIAALAMSVSRKNEEKRTILLFATISTLLAEYSLSLPGGYASLFLITAGVVTGGIYLAHFLDFTNFKPLLFSLYSLIITSAYLIGSKLVYNKNQLPKGFTDNYDFVFSVALLLSVITIIRVVAYKLKNKFSAKFMRYVQFILLPFVIYCISILTDAPGII
jgi:hypothetical protein